MLLPLREKNDDEEPLIERVGNGGFRLAFSPICALRLVVAVSLLPFAGPDHYRPLRQAMIDDIKATAVEAGADTEHTRLDERVLAAMAKVPRHEFVPPDEKEYAYENRPLPIGYGQTISQPYIVALMTDLMNVKPHDVVLEIGTGSGYQAAVLAELAHSVYSIEIIQALQRQAAERLNRLGYINVETRTGDGYYGWDEHAPYDSIIVTAASSHVPPPLLRQLKSGGRIVIPIGAQFLVQYLMLVQKNADGSVSTKQILPVRFVPLRGH
jgi:protein-L-isoaspartate(D-aspartate) O-methyltransferase